MHSLGWTKIFHILLNHVNTSSLAISSISSSLPPKRPSLHLNMSKTPKSAIPNHQTYWLQSQRFSNFQVCLSFFFQSRPKADKMYVSDKNTGLFDTQINEWKGQVIIIKEQTKVRKIHCKWSNATRRDIQITHHIAQQSTAVSANYTSKTHTVARHYTPIPVTWCTSIIT